MAVAISGLLRKDMIEAGFRGGSGINFNAGQLQIRSGTQNAPSGAATGTLLVNIPLNATTGFLISANGVVSANLPTGTAATGTGTAAFFRILRATGTDTGAAATTGQRRLHGSVGTTGADLNLDSTSITASQTVTITSLTITLPAS